MRAARAARTATCALDVEVRWGDGEQLASEHLRGAVRYRLFSEAVPAGEAGFVVQREWLDGESMTLARLQDDQALVSHANGALQTLQLGEQTLVHIGPLVFRVALVEPRTNVAGSSWRETLSPRHQGWTVASFVVHAVALSCMTLMPPRASSLSLDLMSEDTRYAAYLNAPVEPEVLPWTPSEVDTPDKSGESEGARAAGEDGQAGKQDAPSKDRRMAIQGKDSQRVPAKTSASEARTAGILGALASVSTQFGPSSPFGPDKPLGYDPSDAIGQLFGAEIGDDFGFNGLGLKGNGRRGGGDAEDAIGVGKLGTGEGARNAPGARGLMQGGRKSHVPTLRSGPVEIRGALSKETIRRAIHLHLNEVRFCYEQGLASNPQLEGRVSISFLISPSGQVQQAGVKETTLASRSVADCVAQAVRRFSFPAPDGGGYVQVTYPFNFAASGSDGV